MEFLNWGLWFKYFIYLFCAFWYLTGFLERSYDLCISWLILTSVDQRTGSRPHTGVVMNAVYHLSPRLFLVYFLMRRLVVFLAPLSYIWLMHILKSFT